MTIDLLTEMRQVRDKIDQEHRRDAQNEDPDCGMYVFLLSWGLQLLLQAEIERRTV
jgi:hypothetical protein